MRINIILFLALICPAFFFSCNGQTQPEESKNPVKKEHRKVGGPFENESFFFIGMPENLDAVDTSAGWEQKGQKLLITGTIFKRDGKTPAPDVILYYYHTDVKGLYSDGPGLDRSVVRHGYIRGWVKSGPDGKYAIYTTRPSPYPGHHDPAHIHPAIKEPGIANAYYIDEFVFDDDKLLTGKLRDEMPNRGGSGVLRIFQKGDLQVGVHNIILGLHIPDYPDTLTEVIPSGLQIGEDQPSFMPYHASGPDKGSTACPVCKYGRYQGIIYFAGGDCNWEEIKKWLIFLEQQSVQRGQLLKVYFVYGNEKNYDFDKRKKELEEVAAQLNLRMIAMTFVPSFSDTTTEVNRSKINPLAESTLVIYRNRNIVDKYINLEPTQQHFDRIEKVLDRKI